MKVFKINKNKRFIIYSKNSAHEITMRGIFTNESEAFSYMSKCEKETPHLEYYMEISKVVTRYRFYLEESEAL